MFKILVLLALLGAAYAGVVPLAYGSTANVAVNQVGGNFAYSVAEGGHVGYAAYAAPAVYSAYGYGYHY